MKTRFLSLLLLLSFFYLHAQKLKTAEIFGEVYGVNYDKATNLFTMCENITSLSKDCVQRTVQDKNVFQFHDSLIAVLKRQIESYSFRMFESDLKLSDLDSLDYETVKIIMDPSKLTKVNDSTTFILEKAPVEFREFNIIMTASGKYSISNKAVFDSPLLIPKDSVEIKNNDDLVKIIKEELNNNNKTIADYYRSITQKKFLDLLEQLYNTTITKGTDYKYVATETLRTPATPAKLKTATTADIPKALSVDKLFDFYMLLEDNAFHIKVCQDKECQRYLDFDFTVSEAEFINVFNSKHPIFATDNELNKVKLGKLLILINSKIKTKASDKDKKEFKDSLKSTIAALESEGKTYSGQFVINREIPLFKLETKYIYKSKKKDKSESEKTEKREKTDKPESENKDKSIRKFLFFKRTKDTLIKQKVKLRIDSVNVRFFNNRADNITIIGALSNDPNNTRVFTNRMYSLPLREFNHRGQTNSLFDKEGNAYTYYYDDVMDYLPYSKFNYAIKNGEINIKQEDSVKAVERKIGDYFTGIFFSDFLGLNSNNSNSLIVAEGRIRIPWHLRNYGRWTLMDNITAYASVNLFSGFENNSRKIKLVDTFDADETSVANAENFTTNNFNLLSNSNIDAGLLVTPITFEWKGASTFINIRYGLRFIRTGIEYNLKERTTELVGGVSVIQETLVEQKNFQVYSVGQEAEVNFEIRPQSSVGADATVGLNWFRANGTNKNDVGFSTTNNAPNLKVMVNIYALTNSEDSHSGVYFRLGGHYNLGNYKVFPQMMVGYATNLSSFVNKVSDDKK